MHADYEISEEDFLDGQRLAIRNSKSRSLRWSLYVLPSFGCFALFSLIILAAKEGLSQRQLPGLTAGLFFSLFWLSLPLRSKRLQKKLYANNSSMHGRLSIDMDDEGIQFRGQTFSSQVNWDHFSRYFEDDKTFIFYQTNERIFNIVPKRNLTTDQVADIRKYLKLRLGSHS